MITNKEKYVGNKEVSFILKQLETAIQKGDYFSTSVLVTRLKNLGYKLQKVKKGSIEEETVVQ